MREINKITSNFKAGGFEIRCTAELICQSNPSLDVVPWDEGGGGGVEEKEGPGLGKKGGRKKGTAKQRLAIKAKERKDELGEIQSKLTELEFEVEKGEIGGAIEIQSYVRGVQSREKSRERGMGRGGGGVPAEMGDEAKEMGDEAKETKLNAFFEEFSGSTTIARFKKKQQSKIE